MGWLSLFSGIFISCFLLIFLPFDVDNNATLTLKQSLVIGLWGICNAGILWLYGGLISRLIVVRSSSWKLWQHVLWYAVAIALLGIFNAAFHTWLCGTCSNSLGKFGEFILNTFLLLVFPFSFFELYRHIQYLKYQSDSDKTTSLLPPRILLAAGEREKLSILVSDLFYIKSDDNYLDLWIKTDGKITRKTIRGKLKDIELLNEPLLVRCHRSYIINTSKVIALTKKEGKAAVILQEIAVSIPVSASYEEVLSTVFTPKSSYSTPNPS